MEAGAILLIDEVDRSSNRLMALQGVLEGKPVMIKKTGEMITPAPGFNVIATANTKGKGSEEVVDILDSFYKDYGLSPNF